MSRQVVITCEHGWAAAHDFTSPFGREHCREASILDLDVLPSEMIEALGRRLAEKVATLNAQGRPVTPELAGHWAQDLLRAGLSAVEDDA